MADANCSPCFGTVRISRRDFLRLPNDVRGHDGDTLTVITVRNGQCVKLPVEIVRPTRRIESFSSGVVRL